MTQNTLNWLTDFTKSLVPTNNEELIVFLINSAITLIVIRIVSMIVRLSKNKILGLTTAPFSRTDTSGKKILILGDSTAVGTGASRPEDTIAGRLAHDFPEARIYNKAENGGLVGNLNNQIKELNNETFDFIIVSAGGNDVWHMTRLKKLRKQLNEIIPQLTKLSDHRVIFLIYNNIGSAPIFPSIIQHFLKKRCHKVQGVIREVTYEYEVPTINLFSKDRNNPFAKDPDSLFATDGIHPSSEGYRLWYNRLWRKMSENGYHI